jgi:hypothetical protein
MNDYDVVWNGSMKIPLLPERDTLPDDMWIPPKRLYNKRVKLDEPEPLNTSVGPMNGLEEPNE